jgi:pimeloyl-ACP methyl ester carboxylesterase
LRADGSATIAEKGDHETRAAAAELLRPTSPREKRYPMDNPDAIDWTWQGQPLRIGVTRRGAGPTLLLLPALSSISTRAEMAPLQALLSSKYSTIAVDWPGFGWEPKPFIDWRPDAYRAFLAHLLTNVAPKPLATIAVGHAATYALQHAETAPGSAGALCLIAPTWRGPLPTMSGKPAAAFEWFVRLVDLKGIGAFVYALNVNPPVVLMMARGHVYSAPAALTPKRFAEKLKVTRAPGARHASVRFVTGLLDPVKTRADFLAAARRVRDPILAVFGADTPKKSRGEMEALAGLPNVAGRVLALGKLAVQEEDAEGVAAAVEGFLGEALGAIVV